DLMNEFRVVCLSILFLLGGFLYEDSARGAGSHHKEFPSDFDRLQTIFEHPHSLSAATPDWLDLGIEHRTRYETFDESFIRGTAGSNQQVHQRTRVFFGIKDIWDPFRLTVEVADFRAPVADRRQDHEPNFVNHLDIFQLHLDLVSQDFFGTGRFAKLEAGRLIMDFGK